ncbi:Fc.00g020680.m01.CDS01 [Cosmosporella sp. VM-42]
MASDMKASIHRFRLRRTSPSPMDAGRARSASPPLRSPDQQAQSLSSRQSQQSTPRSRPNVPACDRCRSFKKKCSRTFPVCSLCANAGQKCSYSSPIASAEAQAHQLRARVQWLSQYINDNLITSGRDGGIEAVETGTDLAPVLRGLPGGLTTGSGTVSLQQPRAPGPATPPLELNTGRDAGGSLALVAARDQPMINPPSIHVQSNRASPLDPGSVGATSSHLSYQASAEGSVKRGYITRQALPPDAAARRFVDAYFRNVNRAYPFVNQVKIRRGLETLTDLSRRHRDPQLTLLYLVMAIGCTTLERAGQIPSDTTRRFDVAYADIIQECLSTECIESVQILVLLALYSLFDPAGTSAYSIVGIAARQSMLLGLTRRSPDERTQPPGETELRHRLYWSIFVLDRMMAASQGLPVALIDENADVPLPGLTIEEFASSERTTYARNLQTSRHVIQLRQLEDRILRHVHLRRQSDSAVLAPADRRAVLSNIRGDIEDWYSNGCLMSPMEADNLPIHSSITWLSARYYHLLVLLYYPNHFNSSAGAITRPELLQFARKQLQSNSVLFQQRQLPLNRVTLCRLFPVCLVLMHDFAASCGSAEWVAQSNVPFAVRDEVAVLISILEAFPEGWLLARQFVQIVQQFAGVITGGMTAYFEDQAVFPLGVNGASSGKESLQALIKPCISELSQLMQQTLGRATCFQYVEFPPEQREGERVVSGPLPTTQQGSSANPMFFGEGNGGVDTLPSVATRLESRKSLLGSDGSFGHGQYHAGGHQYNQSYIDGDFSPTYHGAPVPMNNQPAFTQPAYVENQGYAYREGLAPSLPATSTLNGNFGFMKSKWPAAFMAISVVQAVLCICFEAYVFAKFQISLGKYNHDDKVQSQYKTIPTFLTLFIFGFLYLLILVWDALRMKNTIQVIGVCIADLALMVYTAIQVDQIQEAITILDQHGALKTDLVPKELWGDIKPYLVAIPAIIAFCTVAMSFVSWKLYQEFAWDILKNIGADYRMKKRFLHYQIYIALLKFDFFFFLGFIVQFVVVVARKDDPEFALTIATIPVTIVILLVAAFFTRRENKAGMVIVILLYLGGLSYFVFKLVRIYQPGYKEFYEAVRKSMTAFAVITILLILLTIANAIVCMHNFGSGLRPHLQSSKKRVDEKPDLNSINLQDVKPQIPSRMTID